jgi:hypothetical protein
VGEREYWGLLLPLSPPKTQDNVAEIFGGESRILFRQVIIGGILEMLNQLINLF